MNVETDEVEQQLRGRLNDVSFLLDEKSIEHDTYLNSDGDEGWHALITVGHQVHGSPLREYTVTYASADSTWLWQATTEDGDEVGPHTLTGLTADASPVEIAEHLTAEVGGGR